MADTKKLWKLVLFLGLFGIVLALYLTNEYFATKPLGFCNLSNSVNCELVTKGYLSKFLGLPVPLVGLAGYVFILVSYFLKNKNLLLGMVTFGMLFCLRLTFLELFVEKVICPVCLLCQLDMFAVFILSLLLRKKEDKVEAKIE